ncbi:MAG: hypothetical protein J7M25_17755 [Deltaproteobacteria bacterium]|nr:hypothetical protein [Deltaproteobacteria bacterium]
MSHRLGSSRNAICIVAILAWTGSASAYVRTTNTNGTAIAWRRSCVFVTPQADGCPDESPQATFAAIEASAKTWNDAATTCNAFIQFVMADPTERADRGFNPKGKNTNVIVWVQDLWGDGSSRYDPQAVALTTLTFVLDKGANDDGEILDADIEVNAVNHAFSTDPQGAVGKYDIQNTLTHEMGHILGLDHTCYSGDLPERPVDDQGNPIPDCDPLSALPSSIRNTTMYPYSVPGETDKRSLSSDDIKGLCAIYPSDQNPNICTPVDLTQKGCGCRTVADSTTPTPWLWWSLLGLGLVLVSRRRRR